MNKTNENEDRFIVDLNNCAKEPIHIPGKIQPNGHVFKVDKDMNILAANSQFIEVFDVGDFENNKVNLKTISPLFNKLESKNDLPFNIILSGEKFVVEDVSFDIENEALLLQMTKQGSSITDTQLALLNSDIETIVNSKSMKDWALALASSIKNLTNYDRVMVYRFDLDNNGEVFEEVKSDFVKESFKGLHYPESDIPKQARELYKTQISRVIFDVNYVPDPIVPQGEQVNLSLCNLRSISPIHIEYLQNMGVSATGVFSILTGDRLWGLVACHNYSGPHILSKSVQRRAVNLVILATQTLNTLLLLEKSRIDNLIHNMGREILGTWSDETTEEFFDSQKERLLSIVPHCDGFVLYAENQYLSYGNTPTEGDFDSLLSYLEPSNKAEPFFTSSIREEPFFREGWVNTGICGLLTVPILGFDQRGNKSFIVWFRNEYCSEVHWGGNPNEKAFFNQEKNRLSPRGSFELWKEITTEQSRKWTFDEIDIGRKIAPFVQSFLSSNYRRKLKVVQELYLQSQRVIDTGKIASKTSHDFNNILQGILGTLKLHKKITDEEFTNGIRKLVKSGEDLVKAMMSYVRYQKNDYEEISPDDLIEDISLFSTVLVPEGVSLIIEKSHSVGRNLRISKQEIFQSIINLIKNSIHALGEEKGSIQITTSTEFIFKKEYFVLRLEDNGSGIDQDILSDIFTPFFTTKTEGKGTGLGLSIIKEIIKAHGGRIEVDSVENVGTTFTLKLPVEFKAQEPMKSSQNDTLAAEVESKDLQTLTQLNVVYIEDEVFLNDLLKKLIGDEVKGFFSFYSGEEFFDQITSDERGLGPYDIILCDMRMPGMTGLAVYEKVRKLDSKIPFFLISGELFLDGVEEIKAEDPYFEVLAKPVEDDELMHLMAKKF